MCREQRGLGLQLTKIETRRGEDFVLVRLALLEQLLW